MAKDLKVYIATLGAFVLTLPAAAEVLTFQCSWEQRVPITITVDTDAMTASRDDGGKSYRVLKVSEWGVWLAVDEPNNQAGVTVQMIVRPAADAIPGRGGKWVDVVMAVTGSVASIDGGVCWER